MPELIHLPDHFTVPSLAVGITGGIGSGKTTVCRALERGGYPVLYADLIARRLMNEDPELIEKITAAFGPMAYSGGAINAAYLAARVFSDDAQIALLNRLVHPAVIAESERLLSQARQTAPLVFYEAALLFEASMVHLFDVVVLLSAPVSSRVERVVVRDRTGADHVLQRMSKQVQNHEELLRQGIIIRNTGTIADLENQTRQMTGVLRERLG